MFNEISFIYNAKCSHQMMQGALVAAKKGLCLVYIITDLKCHFYCTTKYNLKINAYITIIVIYYLF